MSAHLSEIDVVDVAEGSASAEAVEHAAQCAGCRDRVADFARTVRTAVGAEVPEPAPDYWPAFRRDVEARLQDGPRGWWARLLRPVPLLATLAAALVLVAVLVRPVPSLGPAPAAPTPAPMPAWSALPESEEGGLSVIRALGAPPEDAEAESCRAAYDCLASLSDDESAAVTRVLREEIEGRSL